MLPEKHGGQVAEGLILALLRPARDAWRGHVQEDAIAPGDHRYTITEPDRVPWEGLLLGCAAMLPIAAGAVGVWLLDGDMGRLVLRLTLVWSGAIVAFLSGVRRGLSFRAPQGPTLPQIVTFLWLFTLAAAALALGPGVPATVLLLLGFCSLGVFDTLAARKEEAPPYFARLRPLQMLIPVISLLTILARQLA